MDGRGSTTTKASPSTWAEVKPWWWCSKKASAFQSIEKRTSGIIITITVEEGEDDNQHWLPAGRNSKTLSLKLTEASRDVLPSMRTVLSRGG